MKKISMCLICLLLLTGCKTNEIAVLTEECLIPVEFTHMDDIQDFDGEKFFVVSSENGDGISQTGNLIAKIIDQNNSEKVLELGEHSTGYYPVIFDDEKVYAVVNSEKTENINKKEMISVSLGGTKIRTLHEGIPNLSNVYQMKKSDDRIVFFCSNETLNGYEYEIFVYDISAKKSERIISFAYDNEKVEGRIIQSFGVDEQKNLLFVYINEYKNDSVNTLMPDKSYVLAYSFSGGLKQTYVLEMNNFMDLSHEFDGMVDFVTDIVLKDNVIVLITKNGRLKTYLIAKDEMKELTLEGMSENIHSARVLNIKVLDKIYLLAADSVDPQKNNFYVLDPQSGESKKFNLIYDNQKVFPQKIIPYGENGDLLFSVDYLSKDETQVLRKCFNINESFIADEKVLLSEALLQETAFEGYVQRSDFQILS